jgi:hypothetical protein
MFSREKKIIFIKFIYKGGSWSNNRKKGLENLNMGVNQCTLIIPKLNP